MQNVIPTKASAEILFIVLLLPDILKNICSTSGKQKEQADVYITGIPKKDLKGAPPTASDT